MINKIKNLIKRGVVDEVLEDDTQMPLTRVFYLETTQLAQVFTPYGMSVSLPKDQPVVVFAVNGVEKNCAVLGLSGENRFKGLEEGEVQHGNPQTKSSIKYDNEGNVTIDSKKKVTINCAAEIEITAGANATININGDVNITANDVKLTAQQVDIDATQVNLGTGGEQIARVGDTVVVNGQSGIITTGGGNTSI